MNPAPLLDRLAAAGAWRMGEASARTRYSDLDAMTAEDAFRLGHADGAAAAVANFPSVVFGLFSLTEWVERLCDPDAVPGTARPEGAGPLWEALPTFSPESAEGSRLVAQAKAQAPEASALVPLDAYVWGFKRGALAALAVVRKAADALVSIHTDLATLLEPGACP